MRTNLLFLFMYTSFISWTPTAHGHDILTSDDVLMAGLGKPDSCAALTGEGKSTTISSYKASQPDKAGRFARFTIFELTKPKKIFNHALRVTGICQDNDIISLILIARFPKSYAKDVEALLGLYGTTSGKTFQCKDPDPSWDICKVFVSSTVIAHFNGSVEDNFYRVMYNSYENAAEIENTYEATSIP